MKNDMHRAVMNPVTKVVVAREWLRFLSCLLVGMTVVPAIDMICFSDVTFSRFFGFHSALFSSQEWWIAWLLAISPYFAYQFIRSIVWAFRVSRRDQSTNFVGEKDTKRKIIDWKIGLLVGVSALVGYKAMIIISGQPLSSSNMRHFLSAGIVAVIASLLFPILGKHRK